MKLEAAREIVTAMVEILRPYCERIEIGGSIRRGKPEVKDAEIIAIPKPTLLGFMDELVASGAVEKALYGETKTTRWGASYRGMQYQDLKVEVFLADADNWGYIYWLRTGPGDANTFIMQWLKWKQAPIQPKDGVWWRLDTHRLRIATEEDLFALLKMPYIAPAERSVEMYRKILNQWTGDWLHVSKFVIREVPILPPRVSTPYLDEFCRKRDEFALAEYRACWPELKASEAALRTEIGLAESTLMPNALDDLKRDKEGIYYELQRVTARMQSILEDAKLRQQRLEAMIEKEPELTP